MAAQQLISDIVQIQTEEGDLVQVEVDPCLLMSDRQVQAEVNKMKPEDKAKFEDYKKFAEDIKDDTGENQPFDHVMKHLVKVRYPGIPPAVAAQIVQPEEETEEGAVDRPPFQESSSDKALVTAIFP